MIPFEDVNFDLLKLIKENKLSSLLSEQCLLEWPHFLWKGSEKIKMALAQLVNHCANTDLIFYGGNQSKNELTFLYKLEQKQKPVLWCGFWLTLENSKIKKIKLIFDSFEYFEDENKIKIFGFTKQLSDKLQVKSDTDHLDEEALEIINVVKEFFLNRYGFPIQETAFTKDRLAKTAIVAKKHFETSDHFRIILPFFSANEKGPIQFCATIVKMSDFTFKISD
jgi:hypothetical protein